MELLETTEPTHWVVSSSEFIDASNGIGCGAEVTRGVRFPSSTIKEMVTCEPCKAAYEAMYEAIRASNMKVYEKEAALSFSIADRIPDDLVEQDQRSKNRFREHSGEGCGLSTGWRRSHHQPSHVLYYCMCGWIGWLIPPKE